MGDERLTVVEPAIEKGIDLLAMQRRQHSHDLRNHADILSLHKADRLKHYGLHYAKYVGRLARGSDEPKPAQRTIVDAFLVALSAANTLTQDLAKDEAGRSIRQSNAHGIFEFADAAGRFADACEKIDHLEDFVAMAKTANRDIAAWLIGSACERQMNLVDRVEERRRELSARAFYIAD